MLESSGNRLLKEKNDRLRRRTRGHRNLRRRVMSDHSKSQVTKISQRFRPKNVKISLSKTSVLLNQRQYEELGLLRTVVEGDLFWVRPVDHRCEGCPPGCKGHKDRSTHLRTEEGLRTMDEKVGDAARDEGKERRGQGFELRARKSLRRDSSATHIHAQAQCLRSVNASRLACLLETRR